MKKTCNIKITYQNELGIDPDIDDKIRTLMEMVGAEWYGQMFVFENKTREIYFNMEVEV